VALTKLPTNSPLHAYMQCSYTTIAAIAVQEY